MFLDSLKLRGFKSIDAQEGQHISFGEVTVLMGANGSGKSNLVSFFKLLNHMAEGRLQQFVGRYGISQLLHYGPKHTRSIYFDLSFKTSEPLHYQVALCHGLPDRIYIDFERLGGLESESSGKSNLISLQVGGGLAESDLKSIDAPQAKALNQWLQGIRVYQFNDTSETARIKDRVRRDDAYHLKGDGANLAAILSLLKNSPQFLPYYERIIRHIRNVVPQFGDFELRPLPDNQEFVRLQWRDSSGSDYLFGSDQISDGSLRFMALATLLLQPKELMPSMIVLDEPELGLHPMALVELSQMIRIASTNAQVIIATQSPRLVDEFKANEIVVVEWNATTKGTQFKRLDEKALAQWLKDYSLSELWEKNVLGGQP